MGRRVLLTALMLLVLARAAGAQQCLHGPDESASERGRREAAIAFLGQVNARERLAMEQQGTYVALGDAVSTGGVPIGFVPRLTFDRWSYAVSLKDLFDPCGFVVFSDHDGVIYEGRPVARAAASAEATRGPGVSRASIAAILVLPTAGALHPHERDEHGDEREGAQEGDGFEHVVSRD